MIVRQKENITWYQGAGVHCASAGCTAEGRPHCECKYHIIEGDDVLYSGDSYQDAEKFWCERTNSQPFQLGKTKW